MLSTCVGQEVDPLCSLCVKVGFEVCLVKWHEYSFDGGAKAHDEVITNTMCSARRWISVSGEHIRRSRGVCW